MSRSPAFSHALHQTVSESMRQKVEAFCLRQGLLPCRRLLIALSGGADSVSLLHLMKMLEPKFGYSLAAMHINHMIRGEEAKRDEDFCRSLCASMGVDFYSRSIDIPSLAAAEHRGIEETARHYRYAALAECAEQMGADRIATAHTATDQTETVLMQLIRGSATAGGMLPMRGALIRPLLEITREEIIAYTAENALSYVEDSSNADDQYTRNYIRHTVLPVIRSINPHVEQAFGRFAALRRRSDDFMDREAVRRLNIDADAPVRMPIRIDLALMQALEKPLLSHAIAYLCKKGGINGLTHTHFEAMEALIAKGREDSSLSLPSGVVCRIEQGRFCLITCLITSASADHRAQMPDRIEPFELKMGENLLPDGSILFAYTQMNENTEKYINGKQNIYKLFINIALDFGKISNVIRVRSRMSGDRILCGSMHRHIKKCFCDRHIPIEKRALQPILCDDDGILWIPCLNMLRDGVEGDPRSGNDLLHLIYMGDI